MIFSAEELLVCVKCKKEMVIPYEITNETLSEVLNSDIEL